MNRKEVSNLICHAIGQFGRTPEDSALQDIDEGTIIFGNQGILDSLSLLNVLNVVEQELEERYGVKLALTDPETPLESVGGLTDYILGLDSPQRAKKEMAAKKIFLRAFEPDDYRIINAWRQNEEVYSLTAGNKRFVSSERDRQWVLEKIANNLTEEYFAICLKENSRMIGYMSLSNIDYRNSRADWSGIVIGEKEYQGQGYASQAIYLLLEYTFDELGLHRISASPIPENTASLFVTKMMGFQQEGVLRDYVYKGGRRHDLILMSILRPDFDRLRQKFSGAMPL